MKTIVSPLSRAEAARPRSCPGCRPWCPRAGGGALRRCDVTRRGRDPQQAGPNTHSPTRSPCEVVLRDRSGARTVTSRLLAYPSMPSLVPRSAEASTRSMTSASWSAQVDVTCRVPVRSDTGQWMRLSRSPTWNGRMVANSLPSPRRADRLSPTRPTGCGVGAARSKTAGSGRVALVERLDLDRVPIGTRPSCSTPTPATGRPAGVPTASTGRAPRGRPRARTAAGRLGALPARRPQHLVVGPLEDQRRVVQPWYGVHLDPPAHRLTFAERRECDGMFIVGGYRGRVTRDQEVIASKGSRTRSGKGCGRAPREQQHDPEITCPQIRLGRPPAPWRLPSLRRLLDTCELTDGGRRD